jgi:hypothetical protein
MGNSRYSNTDVNNEYLIYPFNSPINYNFNYSGTFSKFGLIDKFYLESLVKNNKRLISGGAEWSDTGMTFSLSDIFYSFSGEILSYTKKYPGLTFSASDSTYSRIDSIVINEDGDIKIKQGLPSSSPVLPTINEDELLIQHAYILPNSIKNYKEPIYYDNTHWISSSYFISGTLSGTYSFISTNNPFGAPPSGGSLPDKCVEINSDYRLGVRFTKQIGSINLSDYGSLTFKVRFENPLPNNKTLITQLQGTSSQVSGTASSSTINLMSYGIDREVYGSWQHIVIPLSKYGTKVEYLKNISFRLIGGSKHENITYKLDDIYLQKGYPYIDEFYNSVNYANTSSSVGSGGSGGGSGTITLNTDLNSGIYITNSTTIDTIYNTSLPDTLSMPSTVGGIPSGTTVAQLKTKNLVQIIDDILFPTVSPTYTIPTILLSGTSQIVEIGSSVSPTFTLTGVKNDAGSFSRLEIKRNLNGTIIQLLESTSLTPVLASPISDLFGYSNPNNPNYSYSISYSTNPAITVPSPSGSGTSTSISYTGYGDYSAGLPKKDSKGVTHTAASQVRSTSAPQAQSTLFTSNQITITGYFPYFYGKTANLSTANDIKTIIQSNSGFTKVLANGSGELSNLNFNANGEYLWFAVFAGYANKQSWFESGLGLWSDIGVAPDNLFLAPQTISITLPITGIVANYKIYLGSKLTSMVSTKVRELPA